MPDETKQPGAPSTPTNGEDGGAEVVAVSIEALLAANQQLVNRLRVALAELDALANTIAGLVEAHGLLVPEKGGKTLRLSPPAATMARIRGGTLKSTIDPDGTTYYTMVFGVQPKAGGVGGPGGGVVRLVKN